MGKKMTKAGAELRRAIRADVDANPGIDHKVLRSKYTVGEAIIESALTRNLAEWDVFIAATPADPIRTARVANTSAEVAKTATDGGATMPGLEQGIVKFTRKPAKMGEDYIFWIPRVYVKNGLVDPSVEYEVYLKKKA
jgi:hypothetical protein